MRSHPLCPLLSMIYHETRNFNDSVCMITIYEFKNILYLLYIEKNTKF